MASTAQMIASDTVCCSLLYSLMVILYSRKCFIKLLENVNMKLWCALYSLNIIRIYLWVGF